MSVTITQDKLAHKPVPTKAKLDKAATTAVTVAPSSLDSIVQAICLDARHESLKYLVRSDTGHDGE